MNKDRVWHGCTTTIIGTSKVVLVVGGYNRGALNTMEMYNPLKNEWTLHSTRLPLRLIHLQVVNSHSLNYLVYVIGGEGSDTEEKRYEDHSAIYGLNKTEKWELVGNLQQKRHYHASLNIQNNDFLDCK